jgi:hypothetical protein
MSAKDIYHIYYNTQDNRTNDIFSNNVDKEDIENILEKETGIKVLGMKQKCGWDEMPSFVVVVVIIIIIIIIIIAVVIFSL